MKKHFIGYLALTILLVCSLSIAFLQSQSIKGQRAWLENRMLMQMGNTYYDVENIDSGVLRKRMRCDIAIQARAVKAHNEMPGYIAPFPYERSRIDHDTELAMSLATQIVGAEMITNKKYWESQCVTIIGRCQQGEASITNHSTTLQPQAAYVRQPKACFALAAG